MPFLYMDKIKDVLVVQKQLKIRNLKTLQAS